MTYGAIALPIVQAAVYRATAGTQQRKTATFKSGAFQGTSEGWQRQAQLGDGDSPRRGTIAKAYRP